ncbi:hypothetical protein AOCH_007091 [Aspergillus ochraceoroseus]|uniref:Uncharacterized protein n=1 Tax=Aspergillus ochraceoroseus TaxID=138278 RepID=A0A0F8V964_9EURO|nr:hypothetical protein AOCH_007091 [Aspergillus ochraceoroseus]
MSPSFTNLIPEVQLLIIARLDFQAKLSLVESKLLPPLWIMRIEDVNKYDDDGNSLLHLAARENFVSAAKFLLSAGAHPSAHMGPGARDPNTTPLLLASRQGNLAIARMLLDHGASVHEWDWSGVSALHYASEAGHAQIVRLLLDSGATQNLNFDIGAPIHGAAGNGHAEIVRLLAARGAELELPRRGVTALALAICNGHLACVEALLDAGAAVSVSGEQRLKCGEWSFPLLLAAGGPRAIEAMSIAEMGVSEICQSPRLAWKLGQKRLYAEMVRLLLRSGADVGQELDSVTALHMAAIAGNHLAVEYLLDAGADIYQRTRRKRSALGFASLLNFDDIVQLLLNAKLGRPKEQKPAVGAKPDLRILNSRNPI